MSAFSAPSMFLVLALPRSRTAWLANWLTSGNVYCGHDLLSECAQFGDLPRLVGWRSLWRVHQGSAETAGVLHLDELQAVRRIVCVHREIDDVRRSLRAIGFPDDVDALASGLAAASVLPGVLNVDYHELREPTVCRAILKHVAPGEPFDAARWAMLTEFNVQITPERRVALVQHSERSGAGLLDA